MLLSIVYRWFKKSKLPTDTFGRPLEWVWHGLAMSKVRSLPEEYPILSNSFIAWLATMNQKRGVCDIILWHIGMHRTGEKVHSVLLKCFRIPVWFIETAGTPRMKNEESWPGMSHWKQVDQIHQNGGCCTRRYQYGIRISELVKLKIPRRSWRSPMFCEVQWWVPPGHFSCTKRLDSSV